ncbi:hypothetical protein GN958_ATG14727 [Phytophthora infestans]|uniref:Uncharacterized protein n=1 Tax=Phytophthora infestans TaxID=4787 RepID=A0A8S9U750_PHYIN|nr:hypothetical protein GN958_ATG14727 [Phytophthora infestans]
MKTVEEYIRKHLPYSFGLVFDGWTTAGVHYVGLFAVFTATDSLPEGRVLLALSPLEDESDLSAQSMSDFLADTLCEFSRPWASVLFVVGDNCSVNQYLGDNGGIPFVGCASHRYNLAVQMFLEDHKYLINKANKLMLKLSTVKGRACLASVTGVNPKIKNETRWSSAMKMLKRCDKLIPALRQLSTKNAVKCGVDKLMLSAAEAMEVSELLKDLQKLDSVTVELQSETLTMLDARELFEHTIESFPSMNKYLCANASIVNNAVFERAVVKLQSVRKLTAAEKAASVRLLSPITNDLATNDNKESSDDEDNISFAQQALKRRRLTGPKEMYIDTNFIPPTSNICERLFS